MPNTSDAVPLISELFHLYTLDLKFFPTQARTSTASWWWWRAVWCWLWWCSTITTGRFNYHHSNITTQLSPQVIAHWTIWSNIRNKTFLSYLNYHHRTAETHVMPMWVGDFHFRQSKHIIQKYRCSSVFDNPRCPCGWVTFTFNSQNISSKNSDAHQFLTIQDAHVGEWLATQSLISSQSVSLHNQNKTQNHSLKHI